MAAGAAVAEPNKTWENSRQMMTLLNEKLIEINFIILALFRAYALRRVKDAFRDNKTLTDPKLIKKQYDFATENLAVIKRQVLVGDLYKTEKLVIEN